MCVVGDDWCAWVGAIPIGSIDPVRRSYDDEVDVLSVLRTAGHASHFGG